MIFCLIYSNNFFSQKIQNGWYVLDENCSESHCINFQIWNSKNYKKSVTTLFLELKHIQIAIPAFDESHQPMLAIQVDENYFSTFENFIQKNNSKQHSIAIIIDNEIIIHGNPIFNTSKTKILFKGKYTFEETKTIAQHINDHIALPLKSKKQIANEKFFEESLNQLLFQKLPIIENSSAVDLLSERFLLRLPDSKLLDKNEFIHLTKSPINNTERLEKSNHKIDTNYFYWSKDFKTCEIKTYIVDKNNNVYILFSFWLKEKNKWKLWRIYLDN